MAIFLIGFMGAGKSTAAERLGRRLHVEVADVDRELVGRFGKPIERVFAEDGETLFRSEEERITLEILGRVGDGVVSLGGGVVLHKSVREALANHTVIWLDVDAGTAWERVKESGRPLARDRASFVDLHREREPLYAAVADAVVPASSAERLDAVLEALEGLPAGAKLLWAASASAEYPAYVGRGLLEPGFWPATVPGRRFLVT